jgi:hypothetical protein
MRSLFGFLGFVAALIVLVAAFAIPALVSPMVATAVRAASPFGDQPLDVQVDLNALQLIRGFVSEIRISGTGLEEDEVTIGALAVTVRGVGIGDHAFSEVQGGLDAIAIPLGDGASVVVDRITLSGSSTNLTANAVLGRTAAIAFLERAFDDQGVTVSGIELTTGGVSLVIFEQRVVLALGVEDGALVVPDMLGAGTLELLAPQPDGPWRLTGVTVTPNGMDIVTAIDPGRIVTGN